MCLGDILNLNSSHVENESDKYVHTLEINV